MIIDVAHLQTWEGKTRDVVDDLSPFKARALAAVLDHELLPSDGDPLPVCWQWLYFLETPLSKATGDDGHPATGQFLPPSPLPRRMWAAGSMECIHPLRLGEPAFKTSRVNKVTHKAGKSGELLFVEVTHELRQADRLCVQEIQNLVYRAMPEAPAILPPGELPDAIADWEEKVTPDPVLLFRYSALTYNSHRIHYDRNYAVTQEFYPALLVHGPLLASLLADAAQRHASGERIVRFTFRAQRPTFDQHDFSLCGKREGNEILLWTVDHEGFIGMKASAILEGDA